MALLMAALGGGMGALGNKKNRGKGALQGAALGAAGGLGLGALGVGAAGAGAGGAGAAPGGGGFLANLFGRGTAAAAPQNTALLGATGSTEGPGGIATPAASHTFNRAKALGGFAKGLADQQSNQQQPYQSYPIQAETGQLPVNFFDLGSRM
jgi:hypothetical protein